MKIVKRKMHARLGDYLFMCDQCGGTYYASVGRLQWNNLFVCPMCFENRPQQDFVRGVKENVRVPIVRERNYTFES